MGLSGPKTVGLGLAGVAGIVVATYYLSTRKLQWKYVGTVDRLFLYPIKGLRCVEVDTGDEEQPPVEVTELGLRCGRLRDRCFVIGRLSQDKRSVEFITTRSTPSLALVKVAPINNFSAIHLTAPNMPSIEVDFPSNNSPVVGFEMCRTSGKGLLCGDNVNKWFCRFLQKADIVLICTVDQSGKPVGYRVPKKDPVRGKYAPDRMKVMGNDSAPIMLATNTSHHDLNSKLISAEKPPVDKGVWKANIFVEPTPDQNQFPEDLWSQVEIGQTHLNRVRPCVRCLVTTVDYSTGTHRTDREPLKTLRTYRLHKDFGNDPAFGLLMDVSNAGTIRRGMSVYAAEKPF